jgi:hypothetical protein
MFSEFLASAFDVVHEINSASILAQLIETNYQPEEMGKDSALLHVDHMIFWSVFEGVAEIHSVEVSLNYPIL